MNANDKFEIFADMFHTMTGHMAPGKDQPVAAGLDAERAHRWGDWLLNNSEILEALNKALDSVFPDKEE